MKKLLSIFIAAVMMALCFAVPIPSIAETSNGDYTYVSSSGDDSGSGTQSSPYATINKALSAVKNGGTIFVVGTIAETTWSAHNKTVTITGGEIDFSAKSSIVFNDNITFDDITLTFKLNAYVFANGYKLTINENVTFTEEADTYGYIRLFGGGNKTVVESTNITVLGGNYYEIYGGSYNGGGVTNDTNVYIGGSTNPSIVAGSHSTKYRIYGGGYNDTIGGNTNIVFTDNAKTDYVVGGSRGANSSIAGTANLTFSGNASAFSVLGGSDTGGSIGGVNLMVYSGTIVQLFGAGQNYQVNADVYVELKGGTITRRAYGGVYNGYSASLGFFAVDITWSTEYNVNGDITMVIWDDVEFTFNAKDSAENNSTFEDLSLYGGSRLYATATENSTIVFVNKTSYNSHSGDLKYHDSGTSAMAVKEAMPSSAADNICYLTYSKSGQTISQSCTATTGSKISTGTATISVDDSVCRTYSGEAIEAAKLTYSSSWIAPTLDITYANNIQVGTATATATVDGVSVSATYSINKGYAQFEAYESVYTANAADITAEDAQGVAEALKIYNSLTSDLKEFYADEKAALDALEAVCEVVSVAGDLIGMLDYATPAMRDDYNQLVADYESIGVKNTYTEDAISTLKQKIGEFSVSLEGGTIKTVSDSAKQNLRFIVSAPEIESASEEYYVKQYGVIMIPEDILGDSELTLETDKISNAYATLSQGESVPGTYYANLSESAKAEENCEREIVARGYVIWTNGTNEYVYYSSNNISGTGVTNGVATKSVYSIARSIATAINGTSEYGTVNYSSDTVPAGTSDLSSISNDKILAFVAANTQVVNAYVSANS